MLWAVSGSLQVDTWPTQRTACPPEAVPFEAKGPLFEWVTSQDVPALSWSSLACNLTCILLYVPTTNKLAIISHGNVLHVTPLG